MDPTSRNLAGTQSDHRNIAFLFQNLDILLFSNAGGSKLSDVENDAKFLTF